MTGIEIDFTRFKLRGDVPPHRQVAAFLKAQIALGALNAGDPVPGAPAVAYRIRVTPAEVRRAYGELVERGYLSSRGGKWRVSDDHRAPSAEAVQDVRDRLEDLLAEARQAGLSRTELRRMVKELLEE